MLSEYVYQIPMNQNEIDSVNQACYDKNASNWDRFPYPTSLPGFLSKYYRPELGKRVLDVGSGVGVLAKWLTDQGLDVHCIDPSSEMVRRTIEKGLKTEQCTIQHYQTTEQFAMVFAILSLIHVPKADFMEAIAKIVTILPKDGLLFLGMIEGKGEGFFENPPRYFSYYSADEIRSNVAPFFKERDYYSKNGYMLFVFERNN